MKQRPFGEGGPDVPVVGEGTWDMEKDDRQSTIAALQRAIDAGVTHVDTAEMYGSGQVEEIVGRALEGRRDEVFLVTKVLPQNATAKKCRKALEKSLKRLRTDRVDCYLIHWPPSHPLEEAVQAMTDLVQGGKALSWGISNFDENQVEEAVKLAGASRIACNQVLHHLQERSIEHAVVPACRKHGIAVVGYSPFGSGDFPKPDTDGGRVLAQVAERHGATPRQVALAFLLEHVDHVIPKAARPEHVEDNAKAADLDLTEEDRRQLEEAFPRGPRRRGVPVL